MPFTAAEILVIIAAIGTVLTNLIVTWRTAGKVGEVAHAVAHNTDLTANIGDKVEVVRHHVNSAASVAAAKIDTLQQEVTLLRTTLADKTQVAAVLAETVARTARTRASDVTLDKIELNTARIP